MQNIILSFDDAYGDSYTDAFPLLEQHGYQAMVFVMVDRIGQTNLWDQPKGRPARRLMSRDQIRELRRRGVRFGSHTLTQPFLRHLSDQDLEREWRDSKSRLEDLLGIEMSSIA